MSFHIGVIGTGYVGLVSGTSFSATGNDVLCVDIDENKVEKLKKGVCPIYEPGLEHLLGRNIREGRLKFTTDLKQAVTGCGILFLCLPTPPNEDGSADLNHVLDVAADIARIIKSENITEKRIVVNKSTVPVGTAGKVKAIFDAELGEGHGVFVASNPEFLREGFAVEDAMKPERVVIGTSSEWVGTTMKELYAPFLRSGNPIYIMDEKSSELTKYAANSFLATKISFMNDLSAYCEKIGADIEKIRMGIGSDSRIGKRFLFAGIGYGGSCFPKDVKALAYSAREAGISLKIVQAAMDVNEDQIKRFIRKIENKFGSDLAGRQFAIWGLAFKPDTDDTREAPAFRVIDYLLEKGAAVTAYDQEAMENTKMRFGDRISYAEDMYSCIEGKDALVIATEWNVFRTPDFDRMAAYMKHRVIFDGRNLYEKSDLSSRHFEYYCIGRN